MRITEQQVLAISFATQYGGVSYASQFAASARALSRRGLMHYVPERQWYALTPRSRALGELVVQVMNDVPWMPGTSLAPVTAAIKAVAPLDINAYLL